MDSAVIVALIGAAVTVGNVLLTNLLSNRKKENAREKAIADGVQCLLRAEIIHAHDKYTRQSYCPIYAKENLTRAYAAYHALGGNDVATSLYEQVMELSEGEEEKKSE